MDMSLDEIIKSKKISKVLPKKFNRKKKNEKPLKKALKRKVFKEKQLIKDARLKIIQKNRAKIRDARDKLIEITRSNGDVRQKLIERKQSIVGKNLRNNFKKMQINKISNRGNGVNRIYNELKNNGNYTIDHYKPMYNKSSEIIERRYDTLKAPRGYVDYDNMENLEKEEFAAASRLSRTVKNDMAYDVAPPAPRSLNSWGSSLNEYDPFDVYEVPLEQENLNEKRSSSDLPSPQETLRSVGSERSPDIYPRRYIPDKSTHLSYEMRTRLERAPDPHASMGIFSNPTKTQMILNSSGYRIVISNLHISVTQSDIKELFEDIGDLYDSRMVRPGIAEVIYKSLTDAEKAVDTYHNRQLDGQPMKCLLVNPRAPAARYSSSSSSNKTPLEIDIDALHKVLFRRN